MRRRLAFYAGNPEAVKKAKKDWLAMMTEEDKMGLELAGPEWWFTREYIYPHRDANAYAWLHLGIAVMAMLTQGLNGFAMVLLLWCLMRLVRIWMDSEQLSGGGVSAIYSILSGFLVGGHLSGGIKEWLPILAGWEVVAQNFAKWALMDPDIPIAHIEGHLYPTILGALISFTLYKFKLL